MHRLLLLVIVLLPVTLTGQTVHPKREARAAQVAKLVSDQTGLVIGSDLPDDTEVCLTRSVAEGYGYACASLGHLRFLWLKKP